MKLDYDCIRDCLLALESLLVFNDDLSFESTSNTAVQEELNGKYSLKNVTYALTKLEEAGYIEAESVFASGQLAILEISDITYVGHEFIGTIRGDNVWEKTKNIASKIGAASFSVLLNIATQVISQLITQHPIA